MNIQKPKLINGSWDPETILWYIDTCRRAGWSDGAIARSLRVTRDRVQYATGAGRPNFERRAIIAELERLQHDRKRA